MEFSTQDFMDLLFLLAGVPTANQYRKDFLIMFRNPLTEFHDRETKMYITLNSTVFDSAPTVSHLSAGSYI